MGKEGRITAHQIAAMLGVSQPTVSRALRGDKKVNEETRARIVALANELNYTVDHNALRLRTQQTYSIALVILVRKGENKANINPFYLSLLGCIAASASERGYNLIISFQDSPANFFANYVGSRQADGLIVIGSGQNVEGWQFFGKFAKHKTPMICWGASMQDLVSIKSDNVQGTRLALDHLASKECRNIAYIGPTDSEQPQFRDRIDSYRNWAAEKGRAVICPPLPENAVREEQGYEAAQALIGEKVAFDGLFCANDFIALGAMRALDERGIAVGKDVRVIGFDGIATGGYAQPPLTTIEQDYVRAGEMLVDALIAVLKGDEPDTTPVPVRLLVRGSA
ncbi:MAG TPA: LacI family DNA-binding transcriptional regulator [Sphingorhabdus sp.]|jgi:DNA-binding LacI/PurR family transcriptional regulator|nr:LacI family DNA-binding transcriptional regulator [Sphingorhabdus sp.]